MKRPQPRRSVLEQADPIAPILPAKAGSPVEPAIPAETAQPAKPTNQAIVEPAPTPPSVYDKMTINFPWELGGKIRGALMIDGFPRGITSQSEWVSEVMQKAIDSLEKKHGPLPEIHAGRIPRGHNARMGN